MGKRSITKPPGFTVVWVHHPEPDADTRLGRALDRLLRASSPASPWRATALPPPASRTGG